MSAAYPDKLNPDQRRAVEHGVSAHEACDPAADAAPALLVIAGAGSGKTTRLPIAWCISPPTGSTPAAYCS